MKDTMTHSEQANELILTTRPLYRTVTRLYNGHFYIGYGHLIQLGEHKDLKEYDSEENKISNLKATKLVEKTLTAIDIKLSKYISNDLKLTQNQYDAICSLVYDIGIKAFVTSEFYLELNKPVLKRDIIKLSSMFRKYNKYKKTPVYQLIKNRKAEMELFMKGVLLQDDNR